MGAIHLLVLMHGMWGNPGHLAELARIARETHAEEGPNGIRLHLLVAETYREDSTYDGVDWGGEMLAKEVMATVKQLKSEGNQVTRFSITGYSLGGLIARYCIGVLDQKGFFEKIEPVNFNTIATPHCGLPRYKSLLSSITSSLGPKLLSRTGEQFYCVDKWSPKGRPLLVVMADPDREFYKALSKFQNIRIYANSVNDRTVPYVTAAIETTDPFADRDTSGIQIDLKSQYDYVIEQYTVPSVAPPKPSTPIVLSIAWFKSLKPEGPILPPFLQFRFPFNLLFYAMLPLIIPGALSLVIIRLSMASRSSRARIKELEKRHGTNRETLFKIIDELEREMEDAVVDLIDNPDPSPVYQGPVSKAHPIISPSHQTIADWLNTLPIKKELAYFPRMANSHATIVSRDVQRFEAHRKGESVIRHWADSFVL